MTNLLRNVMAIVVAIFVGSIVNMGIITIGPMLITPPAGVDVTNADSLSKAMHLFEPRHFIMPFLAHAIGTLVGAMTAYFIAANYKARLAYAIGTVFLCGGIAACFMIPAPAWFMALDLLVAYLPMAWLGIQISARVKQGRASAG